MCSGHVQSGLSPAESEGGSHKADVTLVEMVGVPECVGATLQCRVITDYKIAVNFCIVSISPACCHISPSH